MDKHDISEVIIFICMIIIIVYNIFKAGEFKAYTEVIKKIATQNIQEAIDE